VYLVHVHPQGGEKSEKLYVHPRQNKSKFLGHFLLGGEIWMVGVVNLVLLACVLTATTNKKLSTFLRKKVHPRGNLGYAYDFRAGQLSFRVLVVN